MVYVETQLSSEHIDPIHEWLEKIRLNRNSHELELIEKAVTLARQAHVERERPSAEPYLAHGVSVANILNGLHMDHESLAAAILHEVMEETDLTLERIKNCCGANVAHLVDGVHRMNTINDFLSEGQSLHLPDKTESLRKLLLAMAEDVRVVLIKLGDRLHEMRMLKHLPETEQRRISRETMNLYAPLANRLGIWHVKWELEDLSFRYLEPRAYKQVANFLDERRVDRQVYIDSIIDILRTRLTHDGIKANIKGRPKHIYSIWKKMQRKGISFHELYDVRAVRILVDTLAECYHVLGVVHSLWPHIPKEFDDYIATPKENDYRSIHTAVVGPNGKTVEVQIRTREMNKHAEMGVAAHWRYKEGGRQDSSFEQKIAWLRQILDSREDDTDDSDFIDRFKSAIFQDRVYVMTPNGEVIDLPQGSTPLDFAYYIHTEVGNRCRGAKVNGKIVPLTTTLQSGTHVEILTAKEGHPSRDWLNPQLGYLTTSRARSKARSWFNLLDHDQHLHDGRSILDRELHRLGVRNLNEDQLTQHLKYHDKEEFLAAIGRGDLHSAQIAGAINRMTSKLIKKAPVRTTAEAERHPAEVRGVTDRVLIEGVGNLMTQIAQCCEPQPGDSIIGFITVGRGVSIHRSDCKNILNTAEKDKSRLIEVDWEQEYQETFPAEIEIEAFDRRGLLLDIYGLLREDNINVTASNTQSDSENHTARIVISVEVCDLDQLSKIINRVSQLRNIVEVKRI